ncbi:fibronectin type III domain-containing protein [Stenomitos frigidus]|nr:fibronectin type III domain-containing protein [Stenomitos frigidus]
MSTKPTLLTEPFLQLPTESSVRVVWFTDFAGSRHTVTYGAELSRKAIAHTTQLSRTREDAASKLAKKYSGLTVRPIWRHEAEVTGLKPDQPAPYQVTSVREDGMAVSSETYTLAAKPSPGKPLKILLTSDHQIKPLVAANLQKVVETIGQVDLVLFAGDLVNVADRASEWFDDECGGSLFPALQGRACYELEKNGIKTRYKGGAIIQNAPMYTAIGNHEVMGRFSTKESLNEQFYNTVPHNVGEGSFYDAVLNASRSADPIATDKELVAKRKEWVKDHSFNTDTYEEIFTLPQSPQGGKRYYAETFGDMRLVVLYITNVWRTPSLAADAKGKYQERDQDIKDTHARENWGWGQHLFEPIAKGSPQHNWLEQELNSPTFKQAKYKLVMFHHPPHSLGENIVPAYTDPVQIMATEEVAVKPDASRRFASLGNQPPAPIDPSKPLKETVIKGIHYEYPKQDDYIIRDVVPLLEKANVQLVLYGHSHLWNRFMSPSGMHFLETSNVGNSYGAFVGDRKRNVPTGYKEEYAATGNPNGLKPIVPTIAPLLDAKKQPMPYIASNDITAFSIFDTGTGSISSYRFDIREPKSAVIKFDEFKLKP